MALIPGSNNLSLHSCPAVPSCSLGQPLGGGVGGYSRECWSCSVLMTLPLVLGAPAAPMVTLQLTLGTDTQLCTEQGRTQVASALPALLEDEGLL